MRPIGGTLAIFDAVTVPHEVLPTRAGERIAMAGWFHEAQRPFPDWFDEKATPERGAAEDTVRRLYQQVLELESFETDRALAERADFLANGRVQVHRGHARHWVRPDEALYADQAGFPLAAAPLCCGDEV